MLASLKKWWMRNRLRRELRRDWLTLREYQETDCHGNIMAVYVAEKNGLGVRRIRVVWKRHKKYVLGSPIYVKCLLWADSKDATTRVPMMDTV